MQKNDVQQLLEELKLAYPKYEISSLATQQRSGAFLFVVKGFDLNGDIDDWSVDVVYPLFSKMRGLLNQREEGMGCVRLLFVRDKQFVFYSPDFGLGNVFREMTRLSSLDCYGVLEFQHYVGEAFNIDDVLEYLITTKVWI